MAKGKSSKKPGDVEAKSIHDSMLQIAAFQSGWPAATADDRTVFMGRRASASCRARGENTRGSKVLADFVAWLPKVKQGYAVGAADIEGYTAKRAGLALGLATDLGHLLEGQLAAQDSSTVLQNQRDRAQAGAAQVRGPLGDAIDGSLGEGDTAERTALSGARSNPNTPAGDGAAVTALVKLGADLLGRGGLWTLKCEEGGLTAAKVAAGQAVVTALDAATLGKLQGTTGQTDSPEVNEVEGRLTYEMHDLMAAFAAASKKNTKVSKLVPGPGTRGVLVHKAKPAAPTK